MSFARSWLSEPIQNALRRTARSAVGSLTLAFAAPLFLGAVVFVFAAYAMIVSADTAVVRAAIQDDEHFLEKQSVDPSGGYTVSDLHNEVMDLGSQHQEQGKKGQPQTTYYRYQHGQKVDGDIRDNIQAPDKEHMSSLEEDTSQKQKDHEDFPEPRVVFCPWWSPHCLAQKLHLETPRPDEQLYYVFDRAHPGSPWGLAQRFDLSPSHDGVDGVLYVGQKFAMSDVERRLLQIAFWSLGASFVIAPAIGFVVSRRMLRRVEEVNAVCDRVQRGDLAARASHETAQDEFGELSRHVNSMLDQIHSLVHGLRDVSNRIAHDLRTPIARLKAKIEDAADAPTLEAAQAGAAAAAETQEILETFQALLDIAEVEAGADGGLQPVQLDDTIRSAIDLYGVVAEEAGVRLAADLEPAAMFGEPSLLVRLVANLVDNAIKFSPRGGEVRVSVMRRGGDLALQVQDRGPGVPAEDRESVMRRFVRGAATRATPGHGLGLALVAAVAKRHGARIEMDDAGPGLIVRVLFKAA